MSYPSETLSRTATSKWFVDITASGGTAALLTVFCLASQASELVEKSTGIVRSKALAIDQAELAAQAAMQFAPSPERDAMVRLAQLVVYRSK